MKSAIRFVFKILYTLFLRYGFKEKVITKWEPTSAVVPLTFFSTIEPAFTYLCVCDNKPASTSKENLVTWDI